MKPSRFLLMAELILASIFNLLVKYLQAREGIMFLQVYSSPPLAQAPVRLAREEGSSIQGSCCSVLLTQDPTAASLPKPQEIGRPQAPLKSLLHLHPCS